MFSATIPLHLLLVLFGQGRKGSWESVGGLNLEKAEVRAGRAKLPKSQNICSHCEYPTHPQTSETEETWWII